MFLKKRYKLIFKLLILISIIIVFCIFQNNHISITNIRYYNKKIPKIFEGYKIVQISDLHNKNFGDKQIKLLRKIYQVKPDIIFITGDLIDSKKTNVKAAMDFINGAVTIAPVYYVSGNHEAWSEEYSNLSNELLKADVKILDNEFINIKRGNDSINIIGIPDPAFIKYDYLDESKESKLDEELKKLMDNKSEEFNILLSHRPELIDIYEKNKIDLAFTGHAHGGQFRLPFLGGLVAPDQGFFPKYTSGLYTIKDTSMIVSRGLGNSIIPIRIFNTPEIISVTFKNS